MVDLTITGIISGSNVIFAVSFSNATANHTIAFFLNGSQKTTVVTNASGGASLTFIVASSSTWALNLAQSSTSHLGQTSGTIYKIADSTGSFELRYL